MPCRPIHSELKVKPVPGVHTREVRAEQQLAAALDGLAFITGEWMRRSAAARERAEVTGSPTSTAGSQS